MPHIELGNTSPIDAKKVSPDSLEVTRVPVPVSQAVTHHHVPDDWNLGDILTGITNVFRSHHSDAPPAWVDGDDELIVKALAQQYGVPVGKPAGWGEGDVSVEVPAISPVTPTASGVAVNTTAVIDDESTANQEVA